MVRSLNTQCFGVVFVQKFFSAVHAGKYAELCFDSEAERAASGCLNLNAFIRPDEFDGECGFIDRPQQSQKWVETVGVGEY